MLRVQLRSRSMRCLAIGTVALFALSIVVLQSVQVPQSRSRVSRDHSHGRSAHSASSSSSSSAATAAVATSSTSASTTSATPPPPPPPSHSSGLVLDTLNSGFGLDGWWMSQVPWEVLRMPPCSPTDPLETCGTVIRTECKADSIRDIYQYIPLQESFGEAALVNRLNIRLLVKTEVHQHTNLNAQQVFNIMFMTEYADEGAATINTIALPMSAHFFVVSEDVMLPLNRTPRRVLLALACGGFHGVAMFRQIEVTLQPERRREDCPWPLWPKAAPALAADHYVYRVSNRTAQCSGELTVTTQVSVERIATLERLHEHWRGPVSVVIYYPSLSDQSTALQREWKVQYVEKQLDMFLHERRDCWTVQVVLPTAPNRPYPINGLRNLAIAAASTPYLLLADADFVPSPNLLPHFPALWAAATAASSKPEDLVAVVVPAFEVLSMHAALPETKAALLQQLAAKEALPFRQAQSPLSHQATNYSKWTQHEQLAYSIADFDDKFEPYCIVKASSRLPLYDERFKDYGMNKVTHTLELWAAGYDFIVSTRTWIMHVPHNPSAASRNFLSEMHTRLANRMERFHFIEWLQAQYRLNRC
eukprot:m.72332 g.72332  ORF g.72332 m.72332 type:complete len:590 (-) comp14414_c0_seq1:300-2069(-)